MNKSVKCFMRIFDFRHESRSLGKKTLRNTKFFPTLCPFAQKLRGLWPVFLLFLVSCKNSDGPNVSKIKVDIQLENFEKDFFAIDTNNLEQGLTGLNQKYSKFYPYFINDILGLNNTQIVSENGQLLLNDAGKFSLKFFYRSYKGVNDSVQLKYKNFNFLKDELKDAFQHVKYYYPSYAIPSIITFVAPFDAPGIVLTPKYLGIGLHQFAGKIFSAYQDPEIAGIYPSYVSRRFDKEYITARCIYSVVVTDIYRDSSENLSLIEQMVERGKQWYLLNKLLPDTPDSIKTGYTKNQTEFIEDNEGNLWSQFLKDTPDPYTLDQERMKNYLGDAPFTQDMPHDLEGNGTPGNIGQWLGWRIVEKFAEKNSKMTVQQVLATPAKKIFGEAKYKPK